VASTPMASAFMRPQRRPAACQGPTHLPHLTIRHACVRMCAAAPTCACEHAHTHTQMHMHVHVHENARGRHPTSRCAHPVHSNSKTRVHKHTKETLMKPSLTHTSDTHALRARAHTHTRTHTIHTVAGAEALDLRNIRRHVLDSTDLHHMYT
jgi:hypothetical protein